MTWEAVRPESIFAFSERHLQGDFLGLMAVSTEEVESVFEYLANELLEAD